MPETNITVDIVENKTIDEGKKKKNTYKFEIKNEGDVIALLLEIKLYRIKEKEKELITPIFWNDNYFSVRSQVSYEVIAEYYDDSDNDLYLEIIGWNCEFNKIIKKN